MNVNLIITNKMYIDSVQWTHPSTTLLAGPSNSGKTTIISKILDAYDDNDNFHIVLTDKQLLENQNLKSYLKKLKKNIYLNIIKEHNKGPCFSALQAKTCYLKENMHSGGEIGALFGNNANKNAFNLRHF